MSATAAGVSGSWQAVTHAREPGGYLEHVSSMPLLREVASVSTCLLALQPGERALEIGCGTGVFLSVLANAVGPSGAVVGLDLAPIFVVQDRERTRETHWIPVDQGDAYALAHADGSFDAALCDRVLMHLEDPSAALAEMRRVVIPGGRIVAASLVSGASSTAEWRMSAWWTDESRWCQSSPWTAQTS